MSNDIVNIMLYCLIGLSFLNIVLMGFDRYRCVLDRIFLFSKLSEYRHRFRFRKYHTAFVSDEKNEKAKVVEPISDHFRPFSSLPSST